MKNIWADKRSWHDGMTAFFGVHLVLTVVSLALGTIIGVYGVRALRVLRGSEQAAGGSPEGAQEVPQPSR